jgi:hypothetical protein
VARCRGRRQGGAHAGAGVAACGCVGGAGGQHKRCVRTTTGEVSEVVGGASTGGRQQQSGRGSRRNGLNSFAGRGGRCGDAAISTTTAASAFWVSSVITSPFLPSRAPRKHSRLASAQWRQHVHDGHPLHRPRPPPLRLAPRRRAPSSRRSSTWTLPPSAPWWRRWCCKTSSRSAGKGSRRARRPGTTLAGRCLRCCLEVTAGHGLGPDVRWGGSWRLEPWRRADSPFPFLSL